MEIPGGIIYCLKVYYLHTASSVRTELLTSSQGKLITKETVKKLRKLLFGSSRGSFNDEWTGQNFVFTSVPGLDYGLVQHKVMDMSIISVYILCTHQ